MRKPRHDVKQPTVIGSNQIRAVKGSEIRAHMMLSRNWSSNPEDYSEVPRLTGSCQKGVHYGSGCYDRISTWYTYEK